jgi:hypothetical protein
MGATMERGRCFKLRYAKTQEQDTRVDLAKMRRNSNRLGVGKSAIISEKEEMWRCLQINNPKQRTPPHVVEKNRVVMAAFL